MLALLTSHNLALLAVIAGFVILCMGMWYLWTMQQQLRTEVQMLRSAPAPAPAPAPLAPAPMRGPTAIEPTPLSRDPTTGNTLAYDYQRGASSEPVVHRAETDGSETSDYDDDDEDDDDGEEYTDDEDNDDDRTAAANVSTATTEDPVALDDASTDVSDPAFTAPSAPTPPNLVESLLSSMVTTAIDGAVELQGGASAIMSCVDIGDGATAHDAHDAHDAHASGFEALVDTDDAAVEATSDDDEASHEDAAVATTDDPEAWANKLRVKTVAELKVLCGQQDIAIRCVGGRFKRKEELVQSLLACTEPVAVDSDGSNAAEA